MQTKFTPFYLASQILLVTVFSFLLFSIPSCTNEQGDKKLSDNTEDTGILGDNINTSSTFLSIKRPFEGINENEITEGIHIENPTQASSHTTASGTIINIPANAFMDENDHLITSPIDIKYREIKTATEIILSGIPMKIIDENGDVQWMQTAGMFEIRGFQGDKAVEIAAGESIEIDFVSEVDGEYDFWYFDEEKGNWINKGTNSVEETSAESVNTDLVNEINRLESLTKTEPARPDNDEGNKLIFNDLNLSSCPTLKGKKEIVLMYAGNDADQAPKNNKWINEPRIWHKKTLQPTNVPDVYQLTLLGDKMYQIDVKLALSALEVDRENADYKKRLATYRENMEMLKNKEQILRQQQAAFRRIESVSVFGIYNYDILWKRQDAIALNADFDFKGIPDGVKKMITVYLITDNEKTIVGLPYYDWSKFRFSPSQENKLLAVLPNNKAVFFTNNDFIEEKEKLMEASGNDYVFSMGETSPVNSEEDLEELFTLAR